MAPESVTLTGITVAPSSASAPAGTTKAFTATGQFSNGTTQDLTATVTWSSSAQSVATISASGVASAKTQGSATISAKSGSVTGTTTLTVTAPLLTQIAVAPKNGPATISAGLTLQFSATGTFTDQSTQDLSNSVTWASSAPSIATVSATGLATGLKIGTTNISATSGSVTSGLIPLNVTAPLLVSIAASAAMPSVSAGLTDQFTATGTFTDNSTQNITSSVTWMSSAMGVATISNSGLAQGVAVGMANITATSGSITSNAVTLTITAAVLVSIAVTPPIPSVPAGLSEQFTATGTFTDGTMQNLTNSVTWMSSATGIATINAAGFASTMVPGSSTITATSGSISGSTLLTVTAPVLQSLAISPGSPAIALGTTQQFAATGTFSDGSIQDVSTTVTWSSSDMTVATINTLGLATSLKPGMSTIKATSGSMTGSATLNVTSATVVSIVVTPATPSIPVGTTQQFTATGTFTDATTQDITAAATWTSSDTTVATIAATVTTGGLTIELATAVHTGTTTISASFGSGSVSNSTTLTVIPVSPIAINIVPSNPTIPMLLSQQLTAVEVFNDGSRQVLAVAKWSSQSTNIATITRNGGLATGVAVGSTTISATNAAGTITGSTLLTVDNATLSSFSIAPKIPSIPIGKVLLFSATGTFSDGNVFDLTPQANWSSSASSVANITNFGEVTALSGGSTTIAASFASQADSTSLTVTSGSLTQIVIAPATPSIAMGTTEQFGVTGFYSDGRIVGLRDSVVWSSSDSTIASVAANGGLATGVGPGTVTISATLDSVTGTATLTVTSATLTSIAVTPASSSLPAGVSEQLTATGTFSDSTTQNITSLVHWSSGNSAIAAVSNSPSTIGSVTAVAPSAAPIPVFATLGSVKGSSNLTVTSATLISLAVTPANPTIMLGQSATFVATGTFSDNSVINLSSQVTWTSSNNSVAVVNSSGLATSAGSGTTTIQAAFLNPGGTTTSGSTSLTVQ